MLQIKQEEEYYDLKQITVGVMGLILYLLSTRDISDISQDIIAIFTDDIRSVDIDFTSKISQYRSP